MKIRLFLLLLAAFYGRFVRADVYSYQGLIGRCELLATQQSIGNAEKLLGKQSEFFALQLMKSKDVYPSRFTSFSKGTEPKMIKILKAGGAPNLIADQNWKVTDDAQNIDYVFGVKWKKDVILLPMKISLEPWAIGEYRLNMTLMDSSISLETLYGLFNILNALGGVERDWSVPGPSFAYSYHEPVLHFEWEGWVTNAHDLTATPDYCTHGCGHGITQLRSEVQIHYPAQVLNGTSYHIRLNCSMRPVFNYPSMSVP